ncbi:MAG: cytochrome b [Moritella dasanensis]|jgi:cytochrome b
MVKVKVWDGFIRGYHWLQVSLLFGLWYCADNDEMEWHFVFGYALLALWFTRVIWGLIGSDTAKFSYFIKSPKALIGYLKDKNKFDRIKFGHNPAGACMVVLFLALLATQLFSGLSASDDILSEGPLAQYLSADTVSFLTWIHHVNFDVLLWAIGVHVIAILAYKLKKQPLVKAMFTGVAEYPLVDSIAHPKIRNGLVAWTLYVALAAVVWWQWGHENFGYLLY